MYGYSFRVKIDLLSKDYFTDLKNCITKVEEQSFFVKYIYLTN